MMRVPIWTSLTIALRRSFARAAVLMTLPCLAACGGVAAPAAQERPAAGFTPASEPEPRGVMGADARGLLRLFGEPRLDIRDPTVRKLQFAGSQCILDTYLYPPAPGREPVVTYVDARRPDGLAQPWEACAKLLEKP
jgi:hypothetical protein